MVDRLRADESKGCLPFLSYMCATQWTSVAQNIDIINVLKNKPKAEKDALCQTTQGSFSFLICKCNL